MSFSSVLLFDLGGVLIKSSVFERLDCLLPNPIGRAAIKERWLHSPTVRRFECGELTSDEFAGDFIAEWGLRLTPETFLKEFISWPRKFYPGARELIRDLRKTYRVGCLSNSNPLHWEQLRGFEDDFDIILFSHLLGTVKPDREIFMLALRQCGVESSDVYLFDDCSDNVNAAQKVGITAFHVDGFEALQVVLRVQGILPDVAASEIQTPLQATVSPPI